MRRGQALFGFTGRTVGQTLNEETKWFYKKRWDRLQIPSLFYCMTGML